MMQGNHVFRPATKNDASVLAERVNYAGEGLPLYLWQQMAGPGETAWDVGRRRAARDEGSFSYRNATIIESNDQCAGCLIGYAIPDLPEPIPDKGARQLYQRCGYSEHARRRIVKENWVSEAEYFLLLAKEPEKL
jgi:hypothetical protein